MIARAPGKIVLSGAYAVLEGAPAIVAAVDRDVIADADRPAPLVTEEVGAALAAGAIPRAPWFDASALRVASPDGTTRKLGVGSSAAILVASIAAFCPRLPPDALAAAVFPPAFAAHRAAQPGGSGIDVASSAFGGVIQARLDGPGLSIAPSPLPAGTVVEVFASPVSASTAALVQQVRVFQSKDPAAFRRLLDAAAEGARAAILAASPAAIVEAIRAQIDALAALGDAAGAGIVTPEVASLRPAAAAEGAIFGPSGAGGGDIAVWIGPTPSSPAFRAAAEAQDYALLALRVGARGVEHL